jgi:hypothetical protein
MNTLTVPYLPALDGHDLSSAAAFMERHACREAIDVLNWRAAFPYKPVTSFLIARSRNDLYLHYFVRGLSLRATAVLDGTHVHPDSCVEFFMRKRHETDYINFEFNCIGTCFAERHRTRTDSAPHTPDEFAAIRRHTTLCREPFDEKPGIHEWEITVAIPLRLMGLDPDSLPESICGNFCKCADATEIPHYVTWNPVFLPEPDFHNPAFFGDLYF